MSRNSKPDSQTTHTVKRYIQKELTSNYELSFGKKGEVVAPSFKGVVPF